MINILDLKKIRRVNAKLGTMRKAREWLPQRCSDGSIIVQTEGAIGRFDPATRLGRLTTKGEYFVHLAMAPAYTFPADFIDACMATLEGAPVVTQIVGRS